MKTVLYGVYQLGKLIYTNTDELVACEYARLTNHCSGIPCVVKKIKK